MRFTSLRARVVCAACVLVAALCMLQVEARSDEQGVRLMIQRLDADGQVAETIEAQFNPEEYVVQTAVQERAPGGESIWIDLGYPARRELSFALTYDRSATGGDASQDAKPLRRLLAAVDGEKHRPPVCLVTWGRSLQFQGVLTHLSERYTRFLADGTPVRCVMNVRFTEYSPAEKQLKGNPRH
jgi:hypothetical protein